ncbi:MAG: amino acid permease [Anaerovoracaceae bacterium]
MSEQNKDGQKVEQTERTLRRGIQPWHVSLIALGGIIGSCYFLGSGYTIAEIGPSIAIAYSIGGLVIYAVMASFGELLVNIPRRGSFVSYAKEFIGESFACGAGWAYWINWVGYVPAEAVACGIIMKAFVGGNVILYSIVALALITMVNIYQVKWFGHIESVLSILKIGAIGIFAVCAIGIIFGFIGNAEAVGLSVLHPEGTSWYNAIFPAGSWLVVTTMVMILVNFQGSEIVGLSAAETQDPAKNIPIACRRVAWRIIFIYIIPLVLLVMILPYAEAGLTDSVFSTALIKYGLNWAGVLFSVTVMIAAFSCANSGVYGTVRALYGLAAEGLAPKVFMKLNKYDVPQIATIFTIVPMWAFIPLAALWGESALYTMILGMAGFTGTVCWGGIIASQFMMRRKLKQRGYDANKVLEAKCKWYPVLPAIGLGVIVISLAFMAFQPDLLSAFLFSIAWTVGPMVIYYVMKKMGKTRMVQSLGADEVAFDDKFPVKE